VGWRDGGIIGLELAINHPNRMRKIIAYGASFHPDGVRPDIENNDTFNAYVEKAMADYKALSPSPERLDEFFENIDKM